jgi:hypothetical protein
MIFLRGSGRMQLREAAMPRNSLQRTKLRAAAEAVRSCRSRTSAVAVCISALPGMRRAETGRLETLNHVDHNDAAQRHNSINAHSRPKPAVQASTRAIRLQLCSAKYQARHNLPADSSTAASIALSQSMKMSNESNPGPVQKARRIYARGDFANRYPSQ